MEIIDPNLETTFYFCRTEPLRRTKVMAEDVLMRVENDEERWWFQGCCYGRAEDTAVVGAYMTMKAVAGIRTIRWLGGGQNKNNQAVGRHGGPIVGGGRGAER